MKLNHQVYVGDHYRAKATVQQLAVLLVNPIFNCLNRQWVEHVQIPLAEQVGMEGRADFYNQVPAIRDMAQAHLAAVYSLVALDTKYFNYDAIIAEQIKVIEASKIVDFVRVQYMGGKIKNKEVPSFWEEEGIPSDSRTETFFALKVICNTARWLGVPFYWRSGKRMAKKLGEVAFHFHPNFSGIKPTVLGLEIAPNPGIKIELITKAKGPGIRLESVNWELPFENDIIDGHARLLVDCLRGDYSLASSPEFAIASWKLLDPVLQAWEADRSSEIPQYAAGTDGPQAAAQMLKRDGREWRSL
jgi:glucose-6-phosphate 1-dehydrogenase